MKRSDILTIFLAAGLIAAVVGLFLQPKFSAGNSAEATAAVTTAETQAPKVERYPQKKDGVAVIPKKNDGHYWTPAKVNDRSVKFMVDTGASIVALTYEDARRLGFDPKPEDFKERINTAGGLTYGAWVLLDEIKIGTVEIENVEAMILKDGLEQNLLGMTFLGELNSYEFRKQQLIIRQ